ncbi:MAG: hypothetical protein RID09_02885 [Coleofasciculus sp. G1-WW12-02]|uniref:hypothetical protein n=1 Tax=unclassified Coleofasciculus TaxID=2692782 RepID=UPI0032F5BA48
MLRRKGSQALIAMVIALTATPVLSQSANFGRLTLSPGFSSASGAAIGTTGGSFSLPSLVNRDRENNPCLGYAEETPDHIINLQANFNQLQIAVDSGGQDTTLLITGPKGFKLCGDDTGTSKDASVTSSNFEAGEYKVWVGTINPNQAWNYTLTVRE